MYIYPYMHAGSVITDPSGIVTPSGVPSGPNGKGFGAGRPKKGLFSVVCLSWTKLYDNTGVSKCMERSCSHPKGYKWVECSACNRWWHCSCAGVQSYTAKNPSFVFNCSECQ